MKLPHPPKMNDRDDYEWIYTTIHEIEDGSVIGIVFGPAAFDSNLYHAVLVRRAGPPKNQSMEEYAQAVFKKKSELRNRGLVRKHYSKSVENGKDFYYAVYEGTQSYLVLSLTDNKDSIYVVEADILENSMYDKFQSFDQLINRQWEMFNSMYRSFKVTNVNYNLK